MKYSERVTMAGRVIEIPLRDTDDEVRLPVELVGRIFSELPHLASRLKTTKRALTAPISP